VDLPVKHFKEVYHVGTLRPEERTSFSFEGKMLSVSVHPHAWTRIMRRYSPTTWVFRKSNYPAEQVCFLDMHSILFNPDYADLKQRLSDAALSAHLVTLERGYNYSVYDDDFELERTFFTTDLEEALLETGLESLAEDDPDEPAIRSGYAYVATEEFARQQDYRLDRKGDVQDLAIAEVVRRLYPAIDGVWWDDILDPEGLSAPRGGLFYFSDQDKSKFQLVSCDTKMVSDCSDVSQD